MTVMMNANFDRELTRWFLLDESREDVELRLRQLEATNWISNQTLHVAAYFLTYNAHFDCLTYNGVHFFFARTGRLWKKTVHSGTFLDPYPAHLWWVRAADAGFFLLCLRLFVIEIMEVYKACK